MSVPDLDIRLEGGRSTNLSLRLVSPYDIPNHKQKPERYARRVPDFEGDETMKTVMVTLIQNVALMLVILVVFDLVTSSKTIQGYWQCQIMESVIVGGNYIRLLPYSIRFETDVIFVTCSVSLFLSGLLFDLFPTNFAMNKTTSNPFGLSMREQRQAFG